MVWGCFYVYVLSFCHFVVRPLFLALSFNRKVVAWLLLFRFGFGFFFPTGKSNKRLSFLISLNEQLPENKIISFEYE